MLKFFLGLSVFLFPLIEIVPQSVINIKGLTFFNLVGLMVLIMSFYDKNFSLHPTTTNMKFAFSIITLLLFFEVYNRFFEGDFIVILKLIQISLLAIVIISWTRFNDIRIIFNKIMKFVVILVSLSIILEHFYPGLFTSTYLTASRVDETGARLAGIFKGHFTMAGMFLLIGEAIFLDDLEREPSIQNWVILLIVFMGIAFTGTRVTFIFGVLIFLYHRLLFWRSKIFLTTIFIFLAYYLFTEYATTLQYRFSPEYESSSDIFAYDRPFIWTLYLNEMLTNPYIILFGKAGGSINFRISTHSTYLNIVIKAGIFLFLFFGYYIIATLKYLFQNYGTRSGIFLAFISWVLILFVNENENLYVIIYLLIYLTTTHSFAAEENVFKRNQILKPEAV